MDASDALMLVRQYSETQMSKNPDDTLYKSLADMVKWEEQQEARGARIFSESADKSVQIYTKNDKFGDNRYYDVFDWVSEVDEISQELEKSWKRVLKYVNKKKERKRHIFGRDEYEKPSMEQLRKLLDESNKEMEKSKETKRGRARSWVVKVLDALGQYEYLFQMLPKDDKYSSVFAGAFTACVKAAQTHGSTGEKISECLGRASDQVRTLYKSACDAPDSEYIKRHTVCYYCALFKLLAKLLDEWYRSPTQRLKSILGDSLQTEIRNSMDKLRYHTEQAEKEANSVTNKMWLNVVRLNLGAHCQAGLVGQAIDSPRSRAAHSPPPPPVAAPPERLQIEPSAEASGTDQAYQPEQEGIEDPSPKVDYPQSSADPKPYWSTKTIQEATEHLGRQVQTEKIKDLSAKSRYLSVNQNIYHTLVSWASKGVSEALWIAGPAPDAQPSQNTLTAAFIVAALRNLGVPVVSYFCAYDASRYKTFDLEEEVLKMVGALIHQVAAMLPEQLDSETYTGATAVDLSAERIARLDERKESLPEAIALLADVLAAGPPLLYVIVDGLQVLDKTSSGEGLKSCLRRFAEVLSDAVKASAGQAKIVKVGWFTDHQSWTLQEAYRAGALRKEVFDFEDEDELLGMIKVPDVSRSGEESSNS
ncbi:uncharacterized protein IWZ02DRAFT_93533 [Phyllosticta citriasiana]|uniref:Uncharacterized protein n=1 Tax=Phyllosticta citriasiana TaxID=595635 RepID=A0ABR1KIS7_9PEZI